MSGPTIIAKISMSLSVSIKFTTISENVLPQMKILNVKFKSLYSILCGYLVRHNKKHHKVCRKVVAQQRVGIRRKSKDC